MKGKIIGFTPSSGAGAITSDSGERFTFVAAQWRSEKPITAGTSVDFVGADGAATEIYPVGGAALGSVDVGALSASPMVQRARSLAMETLAFPLAALLLLATFMPALSSPIKSASLWGIGGIAALISANPLLANDNAGAVEARINQLDAMELQLKQQTTGYLGMPVDNSQELRSIAEQRANLNNQLSSARNAGIVTNLLIVRWLVPILAAALLWFCWVGKNTTKLALATGAAAIVTAIVIYVYREVIVGGGGAPEDSMRGMLGSQLDAVISLGFGTYLIGLCGIGLVLAGLGVVKNPLASKTA